MSADVLTRPRPAPVHPDGAGPSDAAPALDAGGPAGAPAAARRMDSLTGLRWIAAFVVFTYHLGKFNYFTGPTGAWLTVAFDRGMLGVSFFFVLSGFVLAVSARPSDRATSFWRRRFARVYPLHLVTAVIAIVLGLTVVHTLRPNGIAPVVANLGLVSSWWPAWTQAVNPVSWSLVCEALFYLSFPFVYRFLRRDAVRPAAVMFCLGLALTFAMPFLHFLVPTLNISFAPIARVPEFVVGVAAARLVQLGAWRGPGLLGATVLTVAGYFLSRTVPSGYGFAAFTIVGFVTLIAAAARRDRRGEPSVWAHPVLVRLGELSFAFYLVHLLVLKIIDTHVPHSGAAQVWVALLSFVLALGASWMLNVLVESPARKVLVRRWRPRRT